MVLEGKAKESMAIPLILRDRWSQERYLILPFCVVATAKARYLDLNQRAAAMMKTTPKRAIHDQINIDTMLGLKSCSTIRTSTTSSAIGLLCLTNSWVPNTINFNHFEMTH